jgi:cellulose synthase/poly-beta-1,6-N-acetylglucosamine synthase-like glycosyltransferase
MILLAVFWLSAACVIYTYVGYPLLLACLGRFRKRRPPRLAAAPTSVSIIVAAHNEGASIERRLAELTGLIDASGLKGEVIVVSDGSTDDTVARAQAQNKGRVRVLELPTRMGKAAALTAGSEAATYEVIVFADTRQTWSPTALKYLVENFANPAVGAVSGDLVVESGPGVLAGVGLYWRFEKWLRQTESRVHSAVGVTGAISAVRRELFRPIPSGTLLDDVYWPLRVAMGGYRVVHDGRAHAYDRLPDRAQDEFHRKIRTLSGNFQLLTRLPGALLPWRNPIWFQFVSHKLLRLVVPWALLAMLVLSALLPGPYYRTVFWGQLGFYLVGLLGLCQGAGARLGMPAAVGSFLVLNAAAWLAFWVWISGRAGLSWRKVSYQPIPVEYTASPLGRSLESAPQPLVSLAINDQRNSA